jgi:hypothetical protein
MIPTYLERLIHEGKGKMKTFSGAMAEQLILTVPDKCYIIIYEYWYRPQIKNLGEAAIQTFDWRDALQYVNFYNQNNYFSYWHYFNPDFKAQPQTQTNYTNPSLVGTNIMVPVVETTQYRETYIKTDRNLAIYFTRQNNLNVAVTNTAVGQFDPLVEEFGYGNETIATNFFGYQAIPGGLYAPLSNNLGPVIAPGTGVGWDNSVNSNPSPTGVGGEITNAANYASLLSALGKARAQHFQCNYVEINMENPRNLQ